MLLPFAHLNIKPPRIDGCAPILFFARLSPIRDRQVFSLARIFRIHSSPVAEGVRIQVGNAIAFAVRKENKDVALRIRREVHPVRAAMSRIPFLRGMERLVGGIADLLDGILESEELEPQEIAKGSRGEQRFAELFRIRPTSLVAAGSALAAVLLLALVWAVPWSLERFALPGYALTRAATNAIVCAVRVLVVLGAAALIPRLRVFNRLCMYRGALNQVINALSGKRRRVQQEDAEHASPISRRSDAAFTLTVALLSIVAFALVRTYTLPVQLLVRLLIVLAVAGVINEPIRLLEKLPAGHPACWLLAPQIGLEHLFVRKPHAQMVEVAVYAWNAALENAK